MDHNTLDAILKIVAIIALLVYILTAAAGFPRR